MPIQIQCLRCNGQYRVADQLAGRKVKCPNCSSHIQVPELSVEEPAWTPPPPAAPPPQEEAWSTPQWGDQDEESEETPENRGMPFPEAPRPGANASPEGTPYQHISFGSVADFSLDTGMITYALHWAGIFIVSTVLAGAILETGMMSLAFLLEAVVLAVSGIGLIGGLGRQAAMKLEHRLPRASDGWSLFGGRWIDLGLIFAVWAIALLLVAIVFGALGGIARIPGIGGILGGFLVIPTFVFILITISILTNLFLLPIIIGFENCSVSEAIKHLLRIVTRNGFAMYYRNLSAFAGIMPFLIFTSLLTAGSLGGALMVCGGENLLLEGMQGFSLRFLLFSFSASTILAIYLAFVVVYATVSFVLVYAEARKRAVVYQ